MLLKAEKTIGFAWIIILLSTFLGFLIGIEDIAIPLTGERPDDFSINAWSFLIASSYFLDFFIFGWAITQIAKAYGSINFQSNVILRIYIFSNIWNVIFSIVVLSIGEYLFVIFLLNSVLVFILTMFGVREFLGIGTREAFGIIFFGNILSLIIGVLVGIPLVIIIAIFGI